MAIFFQPNCTVPSSPVSYVHSPNVRSTLDILWSCLATIIACTYTVLHLNVPEQRRDRDPGWRGDFKWGARRLYKSVKWTAITILTPEYVLAKSWADYANARQELKKLHNKFPATKQTWSITHMLFADMGGFVLQYKKLQSEELELQPVASRAPRVSLTRASADGEIAPLWAVGARDPPVPHMGSSDNESIASARPDSAVVTKQNTDTVNPISHLWHLDAHTVVTAIDEGILTTDIVTAEEINDKSKSDFFTKAIVIIQITYFVVGVLVRAGEHYAITQLELGVVGFVVCSFVTYCLCMWRPKGVCTAYTIKDFGDEPLPVRIKEVQHEFSRGVIFSDTSKSGLDGRPLANDDLPTPGGLRVVTGMCALGTSIIFGAIHLVAWNFDFPSHVDSWLWRIAALVSVGVAPFVLFFFSVVSSAIQAATRWNSFWDDIGEWFTWGAFGLYGIARLVLIVLMFRCLFHPPPDAFTSTWTANIPHIG